MQGTAEVHFFEINHPIAEVTSGQKNSEVQNSDYLSSVFEPPQLDLDSAIFISYDNFCTDNGGHVTWGCAWTASALCTAFSCTGKSNAHPFQP